MSGIVLSASVRQNLLSLQSTADLLATTQNRLSTGKKVNTALDNPTNYFTAQSLDSRASDISNLLDGIGNGVQILQAANTGITSLQKLVDTAKSLANQALQTTVGYSSKSNVSATIAGATSSDLRGTTSFTNATAIGSALYDGTAGGAHAAGVGTASGQSEIGNVVTDGSGNSTVYLGAPANTQSTASVGDLTTAIDLASGAQYVASVSAGVATLGGTASTTLAGITTLSSSTGADLSITGKADSLKALKLTTAVGAGSTTLTAARATSAASLGNLITDGSTLNVDGHIISFKNANVAALGAIPSGSGKQSGTSLVTDGAGNSTVYLQGGTIADVLTAIDLATGSQTASIAGTTATVTTPVGSTASTIASNGTLKLSTGTAADLDITGTGNALSVLGLTGPTGTGTTFAAPRTAGTGGINGKTLTFTSFNGGTPVNVTFGDGTGGTVKTLDQLNATLFANNLQATVDPTGKLTITATNDYASSTLGTVASGGAIGGTVTSALTFSTATAPVADPQAQAVRSNLVKQYNDILAQITTTAQDSSFNGVNLLGGDTLKLTFNETGKSILSITGVNFDAASLGLSNLTSGTDFIDNAATNKVISSLSAASSSHVLQTGSSNLTLADTNEEAANSQALATRQSIAVSALSLANQSQQSVLQLLR